MWLWVGSLVADAARDLAHGVRLLRRNPGFSTVVILTLSMAIAAAVTVFSIGSVLEALLYGANPRDAISFAGAAAALLLVTAAAASIPAVPGHAQGAGDGAARGVTEDSSGDRSKCLESMSWQVYNSRSD